MENLLPQGSAKKDTTHSEKQLGNKHLGNMHPMEPPFPSCMHFLNFLNREESVKFKRLFLTIILTAGTEQTPRRGAHHIPIP